MAKSIKIAALSMALAGSAASAATAADGNTSLSAVATLASGIHADRPRYVTGGWVCPAGFAWRNAGKKDWLCVDPREASRIAWENRTASANRVTAPDGRDACRPGLVAREAFKGDDVCVDPVRQKLVHQMNLALFDAR